MAMTFSPQTRVFAPRDSLMFTSQDSWIDVHPEKKKFGVSENRGPPKSSIINDGGFIQIFPANSG